MEGRLYFGFQTLGLTNLQSYNAIKGLLDSLEATINSIESRGLVSVDVAENWVEEKISGKDFWEVIATVLNSQELGLVSKDIYDRLLNSRIKKGLDFKNIAVNLNNNPDITKNSFYGVLKTNTDWLGVYADYQVSDLQELNDFYEYFLREHPVSEQSFVDRAKKYFLNLDWSNDIAITMRSHGKSSSQASYGQAPTIGICGFSYGVFDTLKTLNDIDLSNKSTQAILGEIAASSGFQCTAQGGNKSHLRFDNINCEFHVKIHTNNTNDGVYYQDRVYFGFAPTCDSRRIYVAHSGQHL